jgi:hypothetical protein
MSVLLFYEGTTMRQRCLGIALCLLVFALPSFAKAPPKPKAPPAGASLDADKLAPGVFAGTVMNPPGADRMFTINVSYQKLQLKPGQNLNRTNQQLQRQYNHIMQLQNQLNHPSRRHNPSGTMQQLQNAMVQFQVQAARAQANMFQVVNATQKVDFQAEEAVKVRVNYLPEQFDDKGNIKKYSKEELAELKGKDKNLPGYESSIDNLTNGQIVQVTLGVHKKPKPATVLNTSTADKDKDKDKDKDAEKDTSKDKDKDTTTQHKLQVRMIVILKDGASPSNSTKPGKSKNK